MSKGVILLVLLCILGGLIQNQQRMARWWHPKPVAQSSGKERVVLYATSWCGYCAQARAFFSQQQIPYRELDVEKSDEGRAEYERLGANGIPIIVIDDRTVIHGFNPGAVLVALE